jgi:urease alpha subunit
MKQDETTGSLEVGKRADFVVLDRDILSVDPETIEDTKVLATYLNGRLVYSASPAATPRTMTRMPGNGRTSARRACARGCIATKPSSS